MIEAKNLNLVYPDGTAAVKELDLKIETGELIYIIGASGSGKTSLLKLFMGMEYPTEGTLQVLGTPIRPDGQKAIQELRRKIGPVFQEFKLIPGRTALENVLMGMRFLKFSPQQMKKEAMEVLVRVGLEKKAASVVEHLSWGENQRVAIARAVARKPRLILADEPTGNLDIQNALNILALFSELKEAQTTVLITTHATHLIEEQQVGRVIRMTAGQMQQLEGGLV